MGPGFLGLAFAAALLQQTPDTATYDSPRTRDLVAGAMVRHRAQDSTVTDYQARIRYRLSFALGRRRWANVPTLGVEEQEARVGWQLPNDLRVDVLGQRFRARNPEWTLNSTFDEPWFVPRGLGDSIRTFGADFPERAALHPLAADGPTYYRYELLDSVGIKTPLGRAIRLTAIRVTPKQAAGALIAGRIWLDIETGEVVRLAFRYVGTNLWVSPEFDTKKDSSEARSANRIVNRILSIDSDLEYALQEGKYWMPYRQILSGKVQIPFVGDYVVPFEAVTTFSDYEINTGQRIVFTEPLPDTTYRATVAGRRARRDTLDARESERLKTDSLGGRRFAGYAPGGRYEIHRPHRDTLRAYRTWGDTLQLELSAEDDRRVKEVQNDLARMVDALPNDITGIRGAGVGYEKLADILRYNRVQGWSGGFGYQASVPGVSFTNAYLTAGYGFSDKRLTGRIALVRDAPGGTLSLTGYHELADQDPLSRGLTFGNSIRAIFWARDDADYYLASGLSLSHESSLARGLDLKLGLRAERQASVVRRAKSSVNDLLFGDGVFEPNPPIAGGDYAVATARLDGVSGGARWSLAVEGQRSTAHEGARTYAAFRQPLFGRRGVAVRINAGLATKDAPPQMMFRAGGRSTVRGFDYGTQRGPAMWSVQTDWTPLRGQLRPVLFADAGQAGALGSLSRQPLLVGGGVGLSALSGLVRLDLSRRITSHPIFNSRGGWRVDLVFGAVR